MAVGPKLFKQGVVGGVTNMSSFVPTPLQEGQWKMSFSGRTPSFGIVRRCCMMSPQERHTKVGMLPGVVGERSLRACNTTHATPLTLAGVLPNSQSPTPSTGRCR